MRKLLLLTYLLTLVICCIGKTAAPDAAATTDSVKNEFQIAPNHVGPITKGMTIKDLYRIYPEEQIKKIKTKTEMGSDTYDNFYIYDNQNKLLLIVSPEKKDDESSRINRFVIRDKRFITDRGISITSNVGEIREAYKEINFVPSVNEIVLFVPEINSNFEISKKNLTKGVWDESTGTIIADSISNSTHTTELTVFWTLGKNHIISSGFWKDLLHRFLNWVIVELPSIVILLLLLTGLLRLQIFLLRRLKKVALNRAYKAENIDNHEAEKRINTLSGIIHGIGKIFLWTIFLLILLGKFNINIAPILASAGIVGLAVGFGAQELVRDFISGFFILLEDQLRTGDMAIINGTTGLVEKIEMRTVTLRDASGVVHIFQNGKINSLSNMTKEWSANVLAIGVAYKEDTDHVSEVMRQVGREMQETPGFKENMLEPVEILGVDQLADSAVIIKVRLKTKPSQQWAVSREFLRRIKKAFDEKNIEIPFPHLSIYTGEATKAMPVKIVSGESKSKPE